MNLDIEAIRDVCRTIDEDQTNYAGYLPAHLDPGSAAAFGAALRDSDLGKYASGGAYGADLTTAIIRGDYCEDCGCAS